MQIIQVLSTVIAAVFLFLFAITKFSRQLQAKAGHKFKSIIHSLTSTPSRGIVAGGIVTSIIQSSTATTVMLVGLVDAGLVSFSSSLGVIFGANVGTTITSQLIALNLAFIAPYIVILGFVLDHVKGHLHKWGKPIFYFGLIFFSLAVVTELVTPLRGNPAIIGVFSSLTSLPAAILAGILLTVIFQSSTITAGLALVLVAQGLLSFDQAVGIVLGANIGTSSTALIAAIPLQINAKRVALAHFLFNLLGVLIILPFLEIFKTIVGSFDVSLSQQVANMHVLFNVFVAIVFLIFVKPFEKLVVMIIK